MPRNHLAVVTMPPFDDGSGYDADLAAKAQRWLEQLDDIWLACRYNHAFPKILPRNGRLPRGVDASPVPGRTGFYQISQTCRDCRIVRTYTCQGDLFARNRSYSYDWPEGYKMPKGASAYITADDINAERTRRVLETLKTLPGWSELAADAELALA